MNEIAIAKAMESPAQKEVERIEAVVKSMPQVELPLTHEFADGLYIRTISMPAGALVVSKIHKTNHPYFITKGSVSVWVEGVGTLKFEAPHKGLTKAGTRRILYIHEDCIWTTVHATDKTDLEQIEKDIIYTPE